MFTLLPADFKKDLMHVYRTRVAVLASIFLLTVVGLSVCMFLPSFLAVKTEHMKLVNEEKSILDSIESKNKGNFSSTIDGLNSDINLISTQDRKVSPIIASIDAKTTPGILVNKISYQFQDAAEFTVSVSGIAQNRKDLGQFVKELQKDPAFKSVDLPLGNLALKAGEPFNISIKGQ